MCKFEKDSIKKVFSFTLVLVLMMLSINCQNTVCKAASAKTLQRVHTVEELSITVTVVANYNRGAWTGVSGVSVSLATDQNLVSYEVVDNNLGASYTSSEVKIEGTITVRTYLSVGSFKVNIGDTDITLYDVFSASSYL